MKPKKLRLISIRRHSIKKRKNKKCKYLLICLSIIEIYILIINLLYLYRHIPYYFSNFSKSLNLFLMNMVSNSYKQTSDYLLKKYSSNNSILLGDNNNPIKTVKIYHENVHKIWIDLIKEDLEGKINIEIDENNPDYLIYSTFGCEQVLRKYNNTIKIAFFTENQIPDLNIADYAIGMSHINYLDRFFVYPHIIYILTIRNITPKMFDEERKKVLNSPIRKKFCAAVITNPIAYRNNFMDELNKYRKLDMGGRFRNNIGRYVKNKIKFLNNYKFSIAMENSEGDGYLTEKILDSFIAGTIPIYYGDYTLDEYINPKSYILIRNRDDVKKKIEYIKKIDNDDDLYRSIIKEKVFTDEFFVGNINNDRKKFLLNIFEQKKEFAKRIDKTDIYDT